MENKKNFLKGALVGALAMFVICTLIIIGSRMGSGKDVVSNKQQDKLREISNLIDQKYLDKVDEDKLQESLYAGYVNGLEDPYSVYYDKEQSQQLLESTAGEYSGIGALLSQNIETKVVTISEVFEAGPAKEAGMKNLDVITKVNGEDVSGEDVTNIVTKIKGKEGTEVKVSVFRAVENKEIELTITRRKVENPTVVVEMKDSQVGYIRVKEFDAVTLEQFSTALTTLDSQGMKGLIIDLRNNPGGNLDTVCNMLRMLLPKGLIVYTEDKDGVRSEEVCEGETPFDRPLAILVNQYSASASEIFAGAVQDYGIGEIVGMKTYGKGVVQQLLPLKDNTYIKLTISEYFTPKGRTINGKGIEPDKEVEFNVNPDNADADNQLDYTMEMISSQIQP